LPRTYSIARLGTGRPGLVAQAKTKVKTLSKNQKEKNKRQDSTQYQKLNHLQSKGKARTAKAVELEEVEQLSAYDSYYKQLSEEVDTVERHVRELRQTPGLESLTQTEAEAQVEFMLRFSAWLFNQHQPMQQITTIDES
jgi:thiamine kinase-like enzyme